MKKTLVAIAALAAASTFAQSTVTLGGEIRFGYQKAPDATRLTKASVGLALTDATLKIGMVEDLGGGLKVAANTQLDQASSAFGNALNRRNTSLALIGGFGTVGFAQTRSSDLLNSAMIAPTNLPEGLYNTSGVIARSPIDSLGYTSPNISGFTGSVSFVESAADGTATPTRRTLTLAGNYSNGPLGLGISFKNTGANGAAVLPVGFRKSNVELLASYDLGIAKIAVGYDSKTNASTLISVANAPKNAFAIGVSAPFGPATVGVNYAKRGNASVAEAGVNYSLSKRTSLNASFGKQSGGNVLAFRQSQYRLSMSHTF